MGELCEVVAGSTPKTSVPEYWDGDIPWITPDDLSRHRTKRIGKGARSLTQAGYDSCSTRLVPEGSILYTTRAPIGYVAIADRPVCTNQGFKNFVPPPTVDSSYLYWYLRHATPEIREMGSGTTFIEVSKKVAQSIPVALPRLSEQRRIVEAIEEQFSRLDAAEESLMAVRARLGLFRGSTIENAFGTLAETQRLGDLAASVSDGPFGSNLKSSHYTDAGPRVIRLANIGEGVFVDEYAHISAEHFATLGKYAVQAGDVVIASLGSSALRSCVIPAEALPAIVKADCIRVRLPDTVDPRYVNFALQRPSLWQRTRSLIHGVGRPRLGIAAIRDLEIPVASFPQQQAVVERVDRDLSVVEEIDKDVVRTLDKSGALRQAVLAEAFSGRLVEEGSEPHEKVTA